MLDLILEEGLTKETLLIVIAYVCALVMALVLHEVSHGYVALLNGDDTAKLYGRLSLNPAKHFDTMGLLFMLLFRFGWAKPVPVNPNNFKKKKWGIISVSFAGVLANFLIAFISAPFVLLFANKLLYASSLSTEYYVFLFLYALASMSLSINLCFGLFNLLPLFPMDGYRLLAGILGEENAFLGFLRRYSFTIMLVLILWDRLPYFGDYSLLNLYIGKFSLILENAFTSFWRIIL